MSYSEIFLNHFAAWAGVAIPWAFCIILVIIVITFVDI